MEQLIVIPFERLFKSPIKDPVDALVTIVTQLWHAREHPLNSFPAGLSLIVANTLLIWLELHQLISTDKKVMLTASENKVIIRWQLN